jgi:hypothetical protein
MTAGGEETWEATDARVAELVRLRRREEARQLLRAMMTQAAGESPFWAGHFADCLGSLLLADQLDREALEAFLDAERLDPTDQSRKLRTASCLLFFLNRPAEALKRLEVTLQAADPSSWIYCDARGMRGVALFRLGRREEAGQVFETIASSAARLPASSCDLRLVDELVEGGQNLSGCRSYLDVVLQKAREEHNEDVSERGMAVLGKLNAVASNS